MERNLDLNASIRACRLCQLGSLRADRNGLAVPPFVGPQYAIGGLAAIAERPAAYEEATGTPFAGPTGDILDGVLDVAGVDRRELLLLNRLMCAIPRGEAAQDYPDAMGNCAQWVSSALASYNPRVVILMGGPAIQLVFGATAKVGETRGMSRTTEGRTYIATYHPAALLRPDHSTEIYDWLVADWRLAAARLREIRGT